MNLCQGTFCNKKEGCLYHKNLETVNPENSIDFSLVYENSCPHFRDEYKYKFENLTLLTSQDLKKSELKKYAQHMEILVEDFQFVAEALMKAGYQVLSYQDKESPEVVMIDYVHPKYEGRIFEETES